MKYTLVAASVMLGVGFLFVGSNDQSTVPATPNIVQAAPNELELQRAETRKQIDQLVVAVNKLKDFKCPALQKNK